MYKLIIKILLLLFLSSFSFSNSIDVATGFDDDGIKIRTKFSFDISHNKDLLNVLYDSGFGIGSQYSSFGIGIKKHNFEIDTYYRKSYGYFILTGQKLSLSKTTLKYKIYEFKGFKLKLQGDYKFSLDDDLDVSDGVVSLNLSREVIENLYFEASYGKDVEYTSNIAISFMLGYGFKNFW